MRNVARGKGNSTKGRYSGIKINVTIACVPPTLLAEALAKKKLKISPQLTPQQSDKVDPEKTQSLLLFYNSENLVALSDHKTHFLIFS